MKRPGYILLIAALLFAGPLAGQPEEGAAPGLEDAVRIEADVDRRSVFLGESIELRLEYWELDFRGLKVQPYVKSGQPRMPDSEGFYAGQVTETSRDSTRGGALYHVTTYSQTLYPARSGKLFIGSWAWQGTVRGHTPSGAQSLPLDLTTPPIEIEVRPLPAPPSTFLGAVGEFSMDVSFESVDLSRGMPVGMVLEISGTGNPFALQAPEIVAEPWFSVGKAVEEGGADEERPGPPFTKRFRYAIMPLREGEYAFPPVSFTYFSPAEARYRVARTSPVDLSIAASGPEEALVVIGAEGRGGGPKLTPMSDGRLPLATSIGELAMHRPVRNLAPLLAVTPPVIFVLLFIFLRGPAFLAWWRNRSVSTPSDAWDFAHVETSSRPFDALEHAVRAMVTERIGQNASAFTAPEIRERVAEVAGSERAESIASVLQACAQYRYGQEAADLGALIDVARAAASGAWTPGEGGGPPL